MMPIDFRGLGIEVRSPNSGGPPSPSERSSWPKASITYLHNWRYVYSISPLGVWYPEGWRAYDLS